MFLYELLIWRKQLLNLVWSAHPSHPKQSSSAPMGRIKHVFFVDGLSVCRAGSTNISITFRGEWADSGIMNGESADSGKLNGECAGSGNASGESADSRTYIEWWIRWHEWRISRPRYFELRINWPRYWESTWVLWMKNQPTLVYWSRHQRIQVLCMENQLIQVLWLENLLVTRIRSFSCLLDCIFDV